MDRLHKKDKNKGEKRKIQTKPRRLMFLLEYPFNHEPASESDLYSLSNPQGFEA